MDVGEGSRSHAPNGMDEHIDLAQTIKRKINYRNLYLLLTMDVEKLRSLADVQPLSLAKKRSMNKIEKETLDKFYNFKNLEKTQLILFVPINKKLEEALKLLGIDTTSKKIKNCWHAN